MAEHKVEGGSMLLFIDPDGGTDYDIVVCLTSVSKSDSVNVIDASSACGPDKSPGALELSYAFEGQHLQDPESGQISGTDLRILLRGEQTIGWKIAPETPQAGDEIETGTGFLSELSSTYSFDSVGTFTGSIQPYGIPELSIQLSPLTLTAVHENPITFTLYQILSSPYYFGNASGGTLPYSFYFTDLLDNDVTSYVSSLFYNGFNASYGYVSGQVQFLTAGTEYFRFHVVDDDGTDTFINIEMLITN
jgi:hypothetical protein